MLVTVKTLNGRKFQVEIDASDSVLELKKRIERLEENAPIPSQKLVFKGKILSDDSSVGSAGVSNGDFVVLMVSRVWRVPCRWYYVALS